MNKKIMFFILSLYPFANFSKEAIALEGGTNFNDILSENPLVVAEFLSPTCGHCKTFEKSGIFKELALEMPEVRFVKISTQNNQNLHNRFAIAGTPTFIFFKNGTERDRVVGGFHFKKDLQNKINKINK